MTGIGSQFGGWGYQNPFNKCSACARSSFPFWNNAAPVQVAVRELEFSYHSGYINIDTYIYIYIFFIRGIPQNSSLIKCLDSNPPAQVAISLLQRGSIHSVFLAARLQVPSPFRRGPEPYEEHGPLRDSSAESMS